VQRLRFSGSATQLYKEARSWRICFKHLFALRDLDKGAAEFISDQALTVFANLEAPHNTTRYILEHRAVFLKGTQIDQSAKLHVPDYPVYG
jgi:hypothetical protein